MMVSGIFLYVGAEVSVSQGVPLYFEEQFGINISEKGLLGTGIFFTFLMIGRFLGGVILNWVSPKKFLIATAITGILGVLGLFSGIQAIAITAVVIMGLGFANVFPLIFSITVDKIPQRTNELSGLMVTAIVGGAIVPLLMNGIADISSVLVGFVIPLCCLVYVLYVGLKNLISV